MISGDEEISFCLDTDATSSLRCLLSHDRLVGK
jgi:hypothetical protein